MGTLIKRLWRGELPLADAFWRYAVVYGLLVNLVTSLLFFAFLVDQAGIAALVAAFLLPIPYNLLVIVGVWRSAGRYAGPHHWAELARYGSIVWMVALTAT